MGGNTSLSSDIARFQAWHRFCRLIHSTQIIIFCALCAAAGFVLLDKLIFLSFIDTTTVISALSCAVLLALLTAYILHGSPAREVCYIVDRKAGLKNLVSTAFEMKGQTNEVSATVTRRAREALNSLKSTGIVSPGLNRAGRYSPVPAIILCAAIFLPQQDLLGQKKQHDAGIAEKAAVKESALRLAAKLTSIESKLENLDGVEAKKIMKDFDALSTNLMGAAKQDALIKLGEFEAKYKKEFSDQRNFEQSAKALSQQPSMDGLPPEARKDLKNLFDDLKNGKLGEAAKDLKNLAKEMEGDKLTRKEKQALARELGKIAENLKGEPMSEKLSKLLRELEASPEDSEKMKQCSKAASDEMKELADFCKDAQNMQAMKDGLKEAKQAMLGDSFNGFDSKEVEKYMEAQASLGGCKPGEGCNGEGQGAGEGEGEGLGKSESEGSGNGGTGNRGHGRGGQPLENMTDTAFKNEMTKSAINKGKILHEIMVYGVPEKGESSTEYASIVEAAKQHAASSLSKDKIPREYEDMVKTYFDSLEKQRKTDEK